MTDEGFSGRSVARLRAVQALYRVEMGGERADVVVRDLVDHPPMAAAGTESGDGGEPVVEMGDIGPADVAWFEDVVQGALSRGTEIDALLARVLEKKKDVGRLEAVLRALLRAATYEFMARIDASARVIISEYVDIAHAFFGGNEPNFVNGVLDRVGHELRPAEFEANDGGRGSAAG